MKQLSWLLLVVSCATTKLEPQPTSLPTSALQPVSLATSQGAVLATPQTTSAPLKVGARCATIQAVLEAEIYRGTPPKSQSQLDAEKAYTGYREKDDHFMRYLKCEYQVGIKGSRYLFNDYLSGVLIQDSLDISMCEGRREQVELEIEAFTEGCTALRRSEYYGNILTPIE